LDAAKVKISFTALDATIAKAEAAVAGGLDDMNVILALALAKAAAEDPNEYTQSEIDQQPATSSSPSASQASRPLPMASTSPSTAAYSPWPASKANTAWQSTPPTAASYLPLRLAARPYSSTSPTATT
ncbi:MAG: hypothetical protein K2N16_03740, partial [Muribaculaceae bacterium]|nr:hypothetical protein [Muribaculaceae bacterium]